MILLLVLLDILINNYTKNSSYFFLIYLYNKPYKYYLLTGIILDFIIFKDLNKNNFYVFIFFMIFNYITYIVLSNIFLNGMYNILVNIGFNLIINLLFYTLAFRTINLKNIK